MLSSSPTAIDLEPGLKHIYQRYYTVSLFKIENNEMMRLGVLIFLKAVGSILFTWLEKRMANFVYVLTLKKSISSLENTVIPFLIFLLLKSPQECTIC